MWAGWPPAESKFPPTIRLPLLIASAATGASVAPPNSLQVEPSQQAVAGNVGVDDGGDTCVLEPPGDLKDREPRCLRPAFDRNLAASRIEADRDAAGEFFRSTLDQFGVAHRRGTDNYARNALGEPGLDGVEIADVQRDIGPDGLAELLKGHLRGQLHKLGEPLDAWIIENARNVLRRAVSR